MAKKFKRDNFRVVVYPRPPGNYGWASISGMTQTEQQWTRDCEEIARDIKRHVDNAWKVEIDYDSEAVCEFCGRSWTEDGTYNGGCCAKDMENEPVQDEAK